VAAARIHRFRRSAWFVAVIGLVICIGALFFAKARMFQAYWVAWIFWSGVSFGGLVIVMMHTLTGGAWGSAVRPFAEAGAMTLPLMALLFVPALFGLGDIFPWVHPAVLSGHDWPHKRAYLTGPWFVVRAIVYFALLCGLMRPLGLWRRGSLLPAIGAGPASGGGLVLYGAVMIFASTDWIASLEPQWYSTMFVVIFMVNHFLAALALCVVLTVCSAGGGVTLTAKQLNDLGNLLLAFVIFWAYVTFSQFLIIWSGNLPREISWYLHRSAGGWSHVTVLLVLVQFAVPFALLLSRSAKGHPRVLGGLASLIFMANAVHVWWLIAPSFQTDGVRFPFLELLALATVGAAWLSGFCFCVQRRFGVAETYEEKGVPNG
jgi:hypothetical protein